MVRGVWHFLCLVGSNNRIRALVDLLWQHNSAVGVVKGILRLLTDTLGRSIKLLCILLMGSAGRCIECRYVWVRRERVQNVFCPPFVPRSALKLGETDPQELTRPSYVNSKLMRNPQSPLRLPHKLSSNENYISVRLSSLSGVRHLMRSLGLLAKCRLPPLNQVSRLLSVSDEPNRTNQQLFAIRFHLFPDSASVFRLIVLNPELTGILTVMVPATARIKQINAKIGQQLRKLDRTFHVPAAARCFLNLTPFEPLRHTQPQEQRHALRDDTPDSSDDFPHQSRPVLKTPTISIRPLVRHRT